MKKTISMKQAEITAAIMTTDKQLVKVESTLGELQLTGADPEIVQNTEDKDNALMQIEEERTALDSSRKLLQELLSKAQEEVISRAASENRRTQVTFGNQNAGFQIGINNGSISGISFGGKGA
jgi:hypothetical protein